MIIEDHVKEIEIDDKKGTVMVILEVDPIKENDFGKPYITYRMNDVKEFLKKRLDKPIGSCYKVSVVSNRSPNLCHGIFGFNLPKEMNAAKRTVPRKKRREPKKNIIQRVSDMETVPVQTQIEVQRQDKDSNRETDISDNGVNIT